MCIIAVALRCDQAEDSEKGVGIMTTLFWIVGAVVLLGAAGAALRRYRALKAPRVITCPDSGHSEAVVVDARHHLAQSLRGETTERLEDCTRWPERADCGQECLQQIDAAPSGCRARALLEDFYAGKVCATCGREFGHDAASWAHQPGLIDADRHVKAWGDIPPRELPTTLAQHQPICWDCKVVETVYDQHPDLITERPARWN